MEKRIEYDKYDSGKTFFLSIVVPQLVAMVFVVFLMVLAGFENNAYNSLIEQTWVTALSAVIAQISFVGLFFAYNKRMKVNYVKATGFEVKTSWRNYVGCIIIAVVALFGFNNIVEVFNQILNVVGYKGSQSMPLPLNNVGWLIYNLIFLALAPAIFEELLFRGIIFSGLKKQGKIKAVFVSALLFMLMHGSLVQTIYPFVLGLVLGFVIMKTENVFCTMLIHFFNNAIVIVMNFVYEVNNIQQEAVNMLNFKEISLSILYAIIAGGIIYLIVKFLLKKQQKKKISLNDINIENIEKNNQITSQKNIFSQNKFMTYGLIIAVVLYVLDIVLGFMG